jgi:outer membrane lipoprotein-sorting protein
VTPLLRWAAIALVSSVLVASPHAARLLPLDDPEIDAGALLALAQGSTTVSFSGYVESQGNLDLPVTESFSDLTDLLVDRTRMRVWWSSPQQWRVDTLHPTGETDLVHNASGTVVWDYERNRAVASSEPRVRLPRASDLLPNELARQLLATATPAEVTRLPAQRVAGLDAPGLRLDPAAEQSSIQHADIWVDPASGLPVRVAVHGKGDVDPSLTTQFLDLDLTAPSADRSGFSTPPRADQTYEDAVDVADAADRYAPTRTPERLAGLARRPGTGSAVGTYGGGATSLLALPLQEEVSTPLREQLAVNARTRTNPAGSALGVGPLNVLLTPAHIDRPSWLLAGTVVPQALRKAARRVDVPAAFR